MSVSGVIDDGEYENGLKIHQEPRFYIENHQTLERQKSVVGQAVQKEPEHPVFRNSVFWDLVHRSRCSEHASNF